MTKVRAAYIAGLVVGLVVGVLAMIAPAGATFLIYGLCAAIGVVILDR